MADYRYRIPDGYKLRAERRQGGFKLVLYSKKYGRRRYLRGVFPNYYALGQYLRQRQLT